jgi:hypothetical protein
MSFEKDTEEELDLGIKKLMQLSIN